MSESKRFAGTSKLRRSSTEDVRERAIGSKTMRQEPSYSGNRMNNRDLWSKSKPNNRQSGPIVHLRSTILL